MGKKEGREIYSYDELKLVPHYIALVFNQFYDTSLLRFISLDNETGKVVIEFMNNQYAYIVDSMKELVGKIDNLFIKNSLCNFDKPEYIYYNSNFWKKSYIK